ncbi:MAG: Na/Pi symporter [Victivallales bacterium]|nr:Na/Pi symporter [Victivallales bacterium]
MKNDSNPGFLARLSGNISALFRVAPIAVLVLLLFVGCSESVEKYPEVIQLHGGGSQSGPKGGMTERPVELLVLGPERMSSGSRRPVPGVEVRITPRPRNGEDVAGKALEGETDEQGIFRAFVPYGEEFGDRYYTVVCPDFENVRPIEFHVTAGLQLHGSGQETVAGNELPEPLRIQVDDEKKGVPVYFKIVSGSHKAKLTNAQTMTDSNGIAATQLITDPDYSGKYEVIAEIGGQDKVIRGVYLTALALNRWKLAIAILGGLGFFIYGMTLMSQGLQMLAGARLKNILQLFTGNRVKAMLAGMGVTALIQSSGATSVMVVGFVNAGLLSLKQGLGVIMGSAIGTTVTGQMVSFKLEALALPAVVLGVAMMLFVKKSSYRGVAQTILGFGLLFFGMMMMSDTSHVVGEFPTFRNFFALFDCTPIPGHIAPPLLPVLGAMLIGLVATVVVQSSSVTVSIAIATAVSGLLNFWTAFALVLGANIGSTLTGLLASIGTSRTARQTALASVVFKVFGVLAMLLLLFVPWNGVPCFLRLVDILTPGDVFAETPQNIGRHIANAHSLFSIFCVMLFLPFLSALAWLATKLVPERKEAESNQIVKLEPHLLNSPSAAMDQVLVALLDMTRCSMALTEGAVRAFVKQDHSTDEKLQEQEDAIDRAQHDIMDYLVQLLRRNLTEAQSAVIPTFMHCVNDVERIGDRAMNVVKLIARVDNAEQKFSTSSLHETLEIGAKLQETGAALIQAISRNDQEHIEKALKHCGEIKALTARFESNHEARLNSQDCNLENGMIYVELLSNLERIAAHLANLAERAHLMLNHHVKFDSEAE